MRQSTALVISRQLTLDGQFLTCHSWGLDPTQPSMKHSPQHSAKAFTLIEVMLAATIMLAGIVGAIQVLVSGSEMLETSRKQAAALQIIDSELARVRML